MSHAVVIGGTGLIGRAIGRRLLESGWSVRLLARDRAHTPADLIAAGAAFAGVDRGDPRSVAQAVGEGADLLVDCICYTAAHARGLLPLLPHVGSTVMISAKAVYVDDAGGHVNSPEPPRFTAPITESQPTVAPDTSDGYMSRYGYAACKVAAEELLLASGFPVTVLRPSKVHGEGAIRPYEWAFVKRAIDRRPVVLLAGRGQGGDHPSAAVNIGALVEVVARKPGRRVLNAADPDRPTSRDIARTIAAHLGHQWKEVLLDEDADAHLGRNPWDRRPPIWLDMTAAHDLGYQPVGDYGETVPPALDWLVSIARTGLGGADLPAGYDAGAFEGMFNYAAEDSYLASGTPHVEVG